MTNATMAAIRKKSQQEDVDYSIEVGYVMANVAALVADFVLSQSRKQKRRR